MPHDNTWFRLRSVGLLIAAAALAAPSAAQETHLHTPKVSGMPEGVPLVCAQPAVTSVATPHNTAVIATSFHACSRHSFHAKLIQIDRITTLI